jgi:hypothetical protein
MNRFEIGLDAALPPHQRYSGLLVLDGSEQLSSALVEVAIS